MYVLAARPFKLWFVNMYHILNEASITLFYLSIFIVIMPRSILSWEDASTSCTYIIMFTWALNVITVFSVTLVKGFKKLRECIRKEKSARILPVNNGKEINTIIFNEVYNITTLPGRKEKSARILPVNNGKETKKNIFNEVYNITTLPDSKSKKVSVKSKW